jgi:hypothetical protein
MDLQIAWQELMDAFRRLEWVVSLQQIVMEWVRKSTSIIKRGIVSNAVA